MRSADLPEPAATRQQNSLVVSQANACTTGIRQANVRSLYVLQRHAKPWC
jgi:hypothetical protein